MEYNTNFWRTVLSKTNHPVTIFSHNWEDVIFYIYAMFNTEEAKREGFRTKRASTSSYKRFHHYFTDMLETNTLLIESTKKLAKHFISPCSILSKVTNEQDEEEYYWN